MEVSNPFVSPPTDPYIEAQTNPPTVRRASPTVEQANAWLQSDPNLTPEDQEQAAVETSDKFRTEQANAVVSDNTITPEKKLEALNPIAKAQGTQDDGAVVSDLVKQLATGDPNDAGLLDLIKTRASWLKERAETSEVVRQKLEDFKAQQQAGAGIEGNSIAGDVVGRGNYFVVQGAETYALPTYAYKYVNILKKYSPDFNLTNYVNVSDVKNDFRNYVAALPPEQAKSFVSEVLDQIQEDAGTLHDNNFEAVEMAQQIFGDDLQPATFVDNIFQIADLLTLGQTTKLAAKLGVVGASALDRGLGKVAGDATSDALSGVSRRAADQETINKTNEILSAVDRAKVGEPVSTPTPSVEEPTPAIGKFTGETHESGVGHIEVKIPDQIVEKPVKVRVGVPAKDEVRVPLVKPLPVTLKHDTAHGTFDNGEHEIIFRSEVDQAVWNAANDHPGKEQYFKYLKELGVTQKQAKRAAVEFKENIEKQVLADTSGAIPGVGRQIVVEPSRLSDFLTAQTKHVSKAKAATTKVITRYTTEKIPGSTQKIQVPVYQSPRIAKGTVASAATQTTKGARMAVAATSGKDAVQATAALGTTPSQVMGSLVLPKVGVDVDELGRPYIEGIAIPETLEQTDKRIGEGLKRRFQERLKDFSWVSTGEGQTVWPIVGDTTGRGFTDPEHLQSVIDEQFKDIPHDVVEHNGEKFIRYSEFSQIGKDDIQANEDLVKAGGAWRQFLGRESGYSEALNRILGGWLRSSTKAAEFGKQLLKPYTRLPSWKKSFVDDVLSQGEELGQVYKRTDPEVAHLKADQYEAYVNVRRFFDHDLAMSDFNARSRLVHDGWHEAEVDGKSLMVRETKEGLPDQANIVELGSNKAVSKDEIAAARRAKRDVKVYELFEDQSDVTHAVVFDNKPARLKPLRPNIGKRIPAYLPRQHNWAFYVYDKATGKSLYGAEDLKQANALVERAKAAHPDLDITHRPAREAIEDPQFFDDLQRLKSEGLLYSSRRNPEKLLGIDGKPKLRSVEHAINTGLRRFENNAGLNRWTDYQLTQLQKTYGDLLRPGTKFALGFKPEAAHVLETADRVRLAHANTALKLVERINGIDTITRNRYLDSIKEGIANSIYERGNKVGNAIADEVSGRTRNVNTVAKSATFAVLLGTNVARNVLMQSSLVPLYMARDGALRYALSGRYAKDFFALTFSRIEATKGLAEKLSPDMVRLWNASGLDELVSDHAFQIGTFADTRVKSTGLLDDTLGRTIRGLQRAGFNIGVRADKRAAFLIETNAFKVRTGHLPSTETELNEVFSATERLAFNQNRSDITPLQQGVFGLITQFQSYNVKVASRILALDNGLNAAERARFWAYSLLTYGFDGFRVGELVDQWEVSNGKFQDPRTKELIKQGAYGYLFNMIGRELTNSDGNVDISGELGPLNFVAPKLEYLTEMFGLTVTNAPKFDWQAPALGLGKDIYDTLNFGVQLMGNNVPLPTEDKLNAFTAEWLKRSPVTSSILKTVIALRTGFIPDRNGSPIVTATTWEALGQLIGAKSENYKEINQLNDMMSNGHTDYTEPELVGALADEARKNADIMGRALLSYGDGKYTYDQVKEMAHQHAITFKGNLPWAEQQYYFNAFGQELDRLGALKSKKLVARLYSTFANGGLRTDQTTLDHLESINHPDVDKFKEFLKSQQYVPSSYPQGKP